MILSLKGEDDPFADDPELRLQQRNRLRVSARVGRELAELEFIAASTFGNMRARCSPMRRSTWERRAGTTASVPACWMRSPCSALIQGPPP